ncbi:Guanylate cyclase 32E [Bulinus truncatus]|nr:Guanylate cyclase 32E [Bulinus truncatus]
MKLLCLDDAVSDKSRYDTFARTSHPVTQITGSIVSLLLHYNWRKISIIYSKNYTKTAFHDSIAIRLKEISSYYNMTINHFMDFPCDYHPLKTPGMFKKYVEDTYEDTRVYVFIGNLNEVVDFTINLSDRGLLDTGEYIVIYIEHQEMVQMEVNKYFKRSFENNSHLPNRRGARSLVVLKPHAYDEKILEDFKDKVRLYDIKMSLKPSMNPFNWTKLVPDHATSLYDAVMLYAVGLAEVLAEGGSYLDGRAIIGKILARNYTSIRGYMNHIDKNGDAVGNYTVWAFQRSVKNETVEESMGPVAGFRIRAIGELPEYHMYEGKSILWVGGRQPVDEPECGYRRVKCILPKCEYVTVSFV